MAQLRRILGKGPRGLRQRISRWRGVYICELFQIFQYLTDTISSNQLLQPRSPYPSVPSVPALRPAPSLIAVAKASALPYSEVEVADLRVSFLETLVQFLIRQDVPAQLRSKVMVQVCADMISGSAVVGTAG
jgi:hypothetical protein